MYRKLQCSCTIAAECETATSALTTWFKLGGKFKVTAPGMASCKPYRSTAYTENLHWEDGLSV